MKIALVTSSRADYGLLKPLVRRLDKDKFFDLRIIATGTHLSREYGYTYKEIEGDGFSIEKKIRILGNSDNAGAITRICGKAMREFGSLYEVMRPDAVLVLGDRYEIFCAVFAALFFKIPVIHYSGGEKTEGAYDDAIRHSITKLSHLHFVSCTEYRNRVIQLGENPARVFNVGSLGVDNIVNTQLLSRNQFEKSIGFKISDPTFLVSFHPETLAGTSPAEQFGEVLAALQKYPHVRIIFTKSNADNDARQINKMMDDFVKKSPNSVAFESLGLLRYLSAIQHCSVIIGNSSSGITEAPSFNKPTVNIGNRQKGRVMAGSIINCRTRQKDIEQAIDKALSPTFAKSLVKHKSPFGNGTSSAQMVSIIKKFDFTDTVVKSFYDLKFN